jgi:hypothetical protein
MSETREIAPLPLMTQVGTPDLTRRSLAVASLHVGWSTSPENLSLSRSLTSDSRISKSFRLVPVKSLWLGYVNFFSVPFSKGFIGRTWT